MHPHPFRNRYQFLIININIFEQFVPDLLIDDIEFLFNRFAIQSLSIDQIYE
jgi:hypothetical protein